MKKTGFTLIELLAVVVVLAIILTIAIPAISGIIKNSAKGAFESDAKMVLKALDYKNLEDDSFDPTTINETNINQLLRLPAENYSSINISREDGKLKIVIVGTGKWNGLVACGDFKSIRVVENGGECDNVPPVLTMLGNDYMLLNIGETYTEAGATALDNIFGDITGDIAVTGTVDTATAGTYVLTYTISDAAGNTTTLTRTVEVLQKVSTFSYTGNYQTFTVPKSGIYQIELWGSSGSADPSYPNNGKGAYTKGSIYLAKDQQLYVYVGQQGDTSRTWKFNGGGYGGLNAGSRSGGGATDIRLTSGTWDNVSSLRSRIMVAAGGGGAAGKDTYNNSGNGGFGGALTGLSGNYYSGNGATGFGLGGSQTAGGAAGANTYSATGTNYAGAFGKGGYSESQSSYVGAGGGGGGYYGGGSGGGVASNGYGNGGAGGSSFISGHTGCNAIDASGVHTGTPNHHSGKTFTNTSMAAGNATMPTQNGSSTMTGNKGDGYAKISLTNIGDIPVITLLGSNPATINLGDAYNDAGATANDLEDGDLSSSIVVTGNVNPNIAGTYTITYTITDGDDNVKMASRTVNVSPLLVASYSYTGNYQTFTVPASGTFQIELWGASGSADPAYPNNGKGAYTKGTITLSSGDILYVYVGQQGDTNRTWKFNGGGYGGLLAGSRSGGGATDIRLTSGTWDDISSLRSRIMVAGAGGGAAGKDIYNGSGNGGFGGALTGLSGNYYSGNGTSGYGLGGSQTAGGAAGVNIENGTGTGYAGSFGKGGYSDSASTNIGSGGGGGGYYGGGPGGAVKNGGSGNGGAGGSSFISGHTGCNAIDASGVHTSQPNHYSGLIFTNTSMVAGNATMPTLDGTSTMTGNKGNGYAKISRVSY